jgi:hypothetical protein
MRDKDLRSSMFFILIAIIVICFLILYVLAKVDAEGYVLIVYPIEYVFNLYQKATPGEKLTILYLPVGGIIGWFLKQWFSKK